MQHPAAHAGLRRRTGHQARVGGCGGSNGDQDDGARRHKAARRARHGWSASSLSIGTISKLHSAKYQDHAQVVLAIQLASRTLSEPHKVSFCLPWLILLSTLVDRVNTIVEYIFVNHGCMVTK